LGAGFHAHCHCLGTELQDRHPSNDQAIVASTKFLHSEIQKWKGERRRQRSGAKASQPAAVAPFVDCSFCPQNTRAKPKGKDDGERNFFGGSSGTYTLPTVADRASPLCLISARNWRLLIARAGSALTLQLASEQVAPRCNRRHSGLPRQPMPSSHPASSSVKRATRNQGLRRPRSHPARPG
jgi:hypothetical protein